MNEWQRIYSITNGCITVKDYSAVSERDGRRIEYKFNSKLEEIEDIENWLSCLDNFDSELHNIASRGDNISVRLISINSTMIEVKM